MSKIMSVSTVLAMGLWVGLGACDGGGVEQEPSGTLVCAAPALAAFTLDPLAGQVDSTQHVALADAPPEASMVRWTVADPQGQRLVLSPSATAREIVFETGAAGTYVIQAETVAEGSAAKVVCAEISVR